MYVSFLRSTIYSAFALLYSVCSHGGDATMGNTFEIVYDYGT